MMLFVRCAENQCVAIVKNVYHSVKSVAEFREPGLCVAESKGLH